MLEPSLSETSSVLSVSYIAKVVAGLGLLACWALVCLFLPSWGLAGFARAAVLALLAVAAVGLPLWAWWRYRRMDELQQRLHERASTFALGASLAGLLLAQLLDTQGLLPILRPLVFAAAMLGLWGLGLALAHEKVS